MRALIPIMIAAFAFTARADQFSAYQGKTYAATEAVQCQADFDRIVQSLERNEGFRVMDGGCAPVFGAARIQLRFTYAHPVVDRIERFSRETRSAQDCANLELSSKGSFENAGHFFVASHCSGKTLLVDYIDFNGHVISRLSLPGIYLNGGQCQGLLDTVQDKLAQREITVLFSSCEERRNFAGQNYHTIVGNLSGKYDKSVETLLGKELLSGEGCLSGSEDYQRKFERAGFDLVNAYCARQNLEGELREYFVYVKKEFYSRIKTFEGVGSQGLPSCEVRLSGIEANLEELGRNVIYSYCQNRGGEQYRPLVYYTDRGRF